MATLATSVRWGTETPAIYFDVSYTASRSGANMVYTVNVDFQALTNNYGRYFGYPIYLDLSLDGVAKVTKTTVKNASPGNWSAGQVYYHSASFSVAKTTGTTSLVIKIYSGDGSSRSQTYTYSLPVSPAGSVLSLPSAGFTIGSAGSISITRYDSSFTDTVTYSVGSASGTITTISSGGSTSFSWTPAVTLYSQMGGATSKTGTITVTTKSGTTTVGTQTYTFTLNGYAPSTLTLPSSFTVGTAGTIQITRNNTSFYDSIVYRVGTAEATIRDISSGGSTSFSWTPPASLYLQMVGKSSITGYIDIWTRTSSNGTTVGSQTYTFTLYAASVYNPPTLSLSYQRGTGTGSSFVASDNGPNLKVTAPITTYGGQTSTYTLKLDGVQKDSYAGFTSGTRVTYIENVSTQSSHTLVANLVDTLGMTAAYTVLVAPEAVPMNINVDLPAVAFGQLAEAVKGLTIAPDWALYNNGTGMVFGNQSSLPSVPSGEAWGRWVGFTRATDKYYLYLSSSNSVWIGTDLNGAGTITWTKIGGGGVDLLTSHGVTNSWYWRKWESGLFEMDGAFRVNPTSPSVWGNGYYSEAFTINLPFAAYAAWITGNGATNVCYVCNASVTAGTNVLSFRIAAPHTLPEGDYDVHLHVTGLWKQSYT